MTAITSPMVMNGIATPLAKPGCPSDNSQPPKTKHKRPIGKMNTSASIFSP